MRTRILGLLAVGLLAGPMAAQAAFIYSMDATPLDDAGTFDFTLTMNALITLDTTFELSDFDFINAPVGTDTVSFLNPLTFSPVVRFEFEDGSLTFFFWDTPFAGSGTYCAGVIGCDDTAAVMTITEVTGVPEPGSLALLGLGLLGLSLTRRRAAN